VHPNVAAESIDPLRGDPFFTVEGVVLEVLGGYGLAHVRAENGSVYGLNCLTAGVEFASGNRWLKSWVRCAGSAWCNGHDRGCPVKLTMTSGVHARV